MIVYLVIFALIQGFTEFLPISSQSHLILFNNFFINENHNILNLTIIAHLGSLIAIIIYHYSLCLKLIFSVSNIFRSDIDKNVVLFKNVIISSMPIFVIVYLMNLFLELEDLSNFKLIGWMTLIFGILLYVFDKACLRIKSINIMDLKTAVFVGLIKCLAIIPGSSRSGLVITSMRFLGFTRYDSTIYSNLLSIPTIAGATIFMIIENYENNVISNILNFDYLVVLLLSFIFSIIFIHFLLNWVKKSSFAIFMIYRVILGITLLFLSYSNVINS